MPKFEVDVTIEVDLSDGSDEDTAFAITDALLQRLWDRDHTGSKPGVPWHFSILEGAATEVVEEPEVWCARHGKSCPYGCIRT